MKRFAIFIVGFFLTLSAFAQVFLVVSEPVISGADEHAHFDTQNASGSKHASWTLRDCTSIDSVITGTTSCGVDALWDYDATEEAAKLTIPSGSDLSLSTSEGQLHGSFSALNPSNSNIISWQVEFKYGTQWADIAANTTPGNDFTTHKLFRLDYDAGPLEERRIEFQTSYDDTDQGATDPVSVFRIRGYDLEIQETDLDGIVPIRILKTTPITDRDEQPGGATGAWQSHAPFSTGDHINGDGGGGKLLPFLHMPGVWIRITCTWDWTGGNDAVELSCIGSDENNDPVTIFAGVDNDPNGMLVQTGTWAVTGSSDLDFNDNGGSNDTIVCNGCNWRGQQFANNFNFDVTGTASNNGQYTVVTVSTTTTSNDTLEVATGSFVDEQNTSGTVTQEGFQKTGADLLRMPELNSSQTSHTADIDFHFWVRNVLVFKDAAVPHGGRPVP